LCPPETGWPSYHRVSLLVASYDTQGYGGVILLRPHKERVQHILWLNAYTTTFCVFSLLYVLLNRIVISVLRCNWNETKKQSKYVSISLDAELTPSDDRLLVAMCSGCGLF
jgi:hypothetical protein